MPTCQLMLPKFNSLAARIKFMSDFTAMVGELEITATAMVPFTGMAMRRSQMCFPSMSSLRRWETVVVTMSPLCHRHIPTLKMVSHHLRVVVNHHQRQSVSA